LKHNSFAFSRQISLKEIAELLTNTPVLQQRYFQFSRQLFCQVQRVKWSRLDAFAI